MRGTIAFILCTVMVACAFIAAGPAAAEPEYIGNVQCKVCHNKKSDGEQWKKWSSSSHAKAFEVLSSDKAKEVAATLGLEKPPNETPKCLVCHVTAYDKETKAVPKATKKEHGVQCETCHGPASEHKELGKKVMFQKDESVKPGEALIKPDAKKCMGCHNDQNPTWNPEKYTLKDDTKAGFDFEQAWKKISHAKPDKEE
jgi:ssDNA-binding Zn-finger/Zn-ribbon topoisomerase 1